MFISFQQCQSCPKMAEMSLIISQTQLMQGLAPPKMSWMQESQVCPARKQSAAAARMSS